jgi:repressor LexA
MGTYEKYKAIAKDKTMYQISKDTGISQSTLSDWKLGKSDLKLDKLKILAKYLGVDISALIED